MEVQSSETIEVPRTCGWCENQWTTKITFQWTICVDGIERGDATRTVQSLKEYQEKKALAEADDTQDILCPQCENFATCCEELRDGYAAFFARTLDSWVSSTHGLIGCSSALAFIFFGGLFYAIAEDASFIASAALAALGGLCLYGLYRLIWRSKGGLARFRKGVRFIKKQFERIPEEELRQLVVACYRKHGALLLVDEDEQYAALLKLAKAARERARAQSTATPGPAAATAQAQAQEAPADEEPATAPSPAPPARKKKRKTAAHPPAEPVEAGADATAVPEEAAAAAGPEDTPPAPAACPYCGAGKEHFSCEGTGERLRCHCANCGYQGD